MSKGAGRVALGIVRTYFPKVTRVSDADAPLEVEVTKADRKSALVCNHNGCAMAVACKRLTKADGVIVSLTTAYIIKGNHATRYDLPESVSREVVSFDREAGFGEGSYHLQPFSKVSRLGARNHGKSGGGNSGRTGTAAKRFTHRTTGVRAALGSKQAPDGIVR